MRRRGRCAGKDGHGWRTWGLRAVAACLAAGCVWGWSDRVAAQADVPAVTDFCAGFVPAAERTGYAASADGRGQPGGAGRALFVTLYADGRHQEVVRFVAGDAVVSFAGEHPAWRLDHGLMWFVQMPVYVREVQVSPPSV
ncbi:hypothetical protein GCM10010885_14200 [Alicyclobacillus cellulosilyticus]|uniref:Uncharacterized protein n=1 Tax=Alicyclobacillus cellulosilyticus TaxID=1003997 RepID=A0A917KD61_9BACL|nr:hypothetical protein [Alicyclobacillus cellulosilyticus]GGJ06210.1 hypothetical protein GCM10010885_14200 [Alicyclobacillus cellulosilyticus]